MRTQITQSNLLFEHIKIENLLSDSPTTLFRYFSSKQARDNFLAGWVWFAGPNQNRFFATDHNGINDPYEYRTDMGTYIGEYALSFSEGLLDPSSFNVELYNALGFVEHIIDSIRSETEHKVSWLNLSELQKYRRILPQVVLAKDMDTSSDATLYISGVGGRKQIYENKKFDKAACYDGIDVAMKARNGNDEFDENEYRFYLQTGGFLSNHNLNGVKYLQLRCPKISNFCRAI